MGARVRRHVGSNVVGYIALMVAVAGVPTAWALARNSVKAKHIAPKAVGASELKTDAVTGTDLNEATLGKVPSAAQADSASSAQTATSANTAANAENANLLDNLNSTDFLRSNDQAGGDLSGSFSNLQIGGNAVGGPEVAPNALGGGDIEESSLNLAGEPWHEVGAPGEPPFVDTEFCVWKNFEAGGHSTAAFFRDRSGVVHLKGVVDADNSGGGVFVCDFDAPDDRVIYTLPAGYRPEKRSVYVTLANGELGRVNVDSNGAVSVDPPTTLDNMKAWVSLDGITFRCAPSGSNGCP